MNNILEDLSAPALVNAIEANMFDYWRLLKHLPEAEMHDSPELLWVMTDIPFSLFNGIFGAKLSSNDVDSAIEAIIARGKSKMVPLLWWTGPATTPTDLGVHLQAHGFIRQDDVPGMAVDLQSLTDSPMPPDFRIEKVNDGEALKAWCRLFAVGFGMPDTMTDTFTEFFGYINSGTQNMLHNYIGWLNEEPVACSSLFLGAGVAGIYCVATIPKARGRGIGAAITLAPLRDARKMGYRVGILKSSKMGYNVYRKLGFKEYCRLGQYEWSPQ